MSIKGFQHLLVGENDQVSTIVERYDYYSLDNLPDMLNANDYLATNAEYPNSTNHGVQFMWTGDHKTCRAYGTADGVAIIYMYNDATHMPKGIVAGKKYYVKCKSTSPYLALAIGYYHRNVADPTQDIFTSDGSITVPDDCVGMYMRIHVPNGRKVTDAFIYDMAIADCMSNQELTVLAENGSGAYNTYANYRAFINSVLLGTVYTSGSASGHAKYENSPYGMVANSLGVPRSNTDYVYRVGAGILYDGGSGTLKAAIKNSDITGLDYLLTQFWILDLDNFNLGTVDSLSVELSLAGAVVDILEYINSHNSLCQLILVGPPPVSYVHKGDTVFTENYAKGYSIADVDELMNEMARKYHFIYISWKDMPLSYFYQNYTDGNNVHANDEKVYRVMGEYLSFCVSHANTSTILSMDEDDILYLGG